MRKYGAYVKRMLDFPYKHDLLSFAGLFFAFTLPLLLTGIVLLWGSSSGQARHEKLIDILPAALIAVFFLYIIVMAVYLQKKIIPFGLKMSEMELRHTSQFSSSKNNDMLNALSGLDSYFKTLTDREYNLKLLQKQAELDALQSQINPHFLYNTLDTIRGQALEEGSVQTSDMIEALSTLLRYTIGQRGDMVTLGQELKSLDNYIKIQQFRFYNRFTYNKAIEDLDENILMRKIPKMTLQPFVENAIFHGVESLPGEGRINVEIFTTQSRLIISISDNGVGMDEIQLEKLRKKLKTGDFAPELKEKKHGSGIAVTNVNARIKLAFGESYGVTAYSTKGVGSQFQISMPLMEEYGEKRNIATGAS